MYNLFLTLFVFLFVTSNICYFGGSWNRLLRLRHCFVILALKLTFWPLLSLLNSIKTLLSLVPIDRVTSGLTPIVTMTFFWTPNENERRKRQKRGPDKICFFWSFYILLHYKESWYVIKTQKNDRQEIAVHLQKIANQ